MRVRRTLARGTLRATRWRLVGRSKVEYWKPGFYRIAQQTDLPISLGFVDRPTRTLGVGPAFHPTGHVKKDMDFVRAFYAEKQGIRPECRTEPRLREEAD